MSKRRPRGQDLNLFGGDSQPTLQETADEIYGKSLLPDVDGQRQVARPIDIFKIYPDPTQPRRALPSPVRAGWDGEPTGIPALFGLWVDLIRADENPDFDLYDFLNQGYLPNGIEGDDDERGGGFDPGPFEHGLRAVVDLAISIRTVGLTNPITVARRGSAFRLETGERRWLAYHLLHSVAPDADWSQIPARIVDQPSVWRQASENNARADLNAIGRARQLAILLMDLLAEHQGMQFASYEDVIAAGHSERAFYAQVADGEKFRIPRGQGERLLDAMGLKSVVQLRQYRALLRLPDEVWQYADDHNLTERELRDISGDTVTAVTVSVRPDPPRAQPPNALTESINRRRRTRVWAYAARLDSLNDKERAQALEMIEQDERWLAELRHAIESRL